MSDWRDESQTVKFRFRLSGEESGYALRMLAPPAGHLESALSSVSTRLAFSTRDKDNDQKNDMNCAKQLSGKTSRSVLLVEDKLVLHQINCSVAFVLQAAGGSVTAEGPT